MKEMNVNVINPGNELIIRQGEATPIIMPEVVELSGDINTISAYISKRKNADPKIAKFQAINKDTVIVTVDKKNLTIRVDFDPSDTYAPAINGRLEMSEELKPFAINSLRTFSKDEIVKLLKFARLSFDSSEKWAEVLQAYRSFTAQANTDIKQESDNRGNKIANFAKAVYTNIPTEFILNIPIFKGQNKERFRVEICIDVTDGGAKFWFESVELAEIQQTRVDEIFAEQLKECSEYVIINV